MSPFFNASVISKKLSVSSKYTSINISENISEISLFGIFILALFFITSYSFVKVKYPLWKNKFQIFLLKFASKFWKVMLSFILFTILSPFNNFEKSSKISFFNFSKYNLINPFPLVFTQYGFNFLSLKKLIIDQGLYTFLSPNKYPLYHFWTSSNSYSKSKSSKACTTSVSATPKYSVNLSSKIVWTFKLFNPEKIFSFATLKIPVITPISRYSLSFKTNP